ncbi:hypothetical protein ACLKA6_018974 [Drosophila palustris]
MQRHEKQILDLTRRLEQQQLPAQPFTHLPLQMYQLYLAPQQPPPKSQKNKQLSFNLLQLMEDDSCHVAAEECVPIVYT